MGTWLSTQRHLAPNCANLTTCTHTHTHAHTHHMHTHIHAHTHTTRAHTTHEHTHTTRTHTHTHTHIHTHTHTTVVMMLMVLLTIYFDLFLFCVYECFVCMSVGRRSYLLGLESRMPKSPTGSVVCVLNPLSHFSSPIKYNILRDNIS